MGLPQPDPPRRRRGQPQGRGPDPGPHAPAGPRAAPHFGHLVEAAERERDETAALLEAAGATPFDEYFDHEGTRHLRVLPAVHKVTSRPDHVTPHVYVQAEGGTKRINQSLAEDEAFWARAVIETLRHTGVRVEELTEITHLALVSYKLPDTGEIVPLLQIVPSKSNEERLLLVSPELASVLATIIKRLRDANGGKIPLVARYDDHERVTGPLLPHLFQRRHYWQAQVSSCARSPWAPAGAPTEPPASTNTPASAAQFSRSTHGSDPGSSRSSRTSANASARPVPTAGWEKSKDSRSASPPPPPSCTASSALPPTAGHSWSTWACPSSPTTHRRPNRMREGLGRKADH